MAGDSTPSVGGIIMAIVFAVILVLGLAFWGPFIVAGVRDCYSSRHGGRGRGSAKFLRSNSSQVQSTNSNPAAERERVPEIHERTTEVEGMGPLMTTTQFFELHGRWPTHGEKRRLHAAAILPPPKTAAPQRRREAQAPADTKDEIKTQADNIKAQVPTDDEAQGKENMRTVAPAHIPRSRGRNSLVFRKRRDGHRVGGKLRDGK